MGFSWLLPGLSAKNFGGKNLTKSCVVLMCLCSVFCDASTMASVPVGFEVNASDRDKVWVSENGVFAFGFLEVDMNNDNEYVVGIMYNLGDKSANLPVWSVGGGLKVPLNSTFRFEMDGRLVLINNPSRITLWSSNTSDLGVEKASLLDNGNLVLLNSKGEVMWESFARPTNALLPGQSLRYPQTLRALSTRLISSYYSMVIRQDGELALVWEHNVTYWRSRFSSKQAKFNSSGVLGLYDDRDNVVWSVSPKDLGDPSVILRHLRMDRDGNLRIYSWDGRGWKAVWQAVDDQCSVFGSCGFFSVCGYNSSGPVCDCLSSDSLNTGGPTLDTGGLGCKKMADLGNCRMNTSVLVLKQTVLYGIYPSRDVEMSLSESACRERCVNDSSCIAATSMDDGSGRCTLKRTSFISGYKTADIHAVSFLKVCSVPLAVPTQGNHIDRRTDSQSSSNGRGSSRWLVVAIAVVVLLTVVVIVGFQALVFLILHRRRKIRVRTRIPFGKDARMNPHYSLLIRLSFDEIKELTNDFSDKLGTSVYKGVLPNKTPVVAKVLKDVVVSEKEFRVKVSTLSGTHHRNLVSMKGFCFEQGNKCLVYEYVPHGSLDEWLLASRGWQEKLDVALGVARGLAYLHSECQKCITHGNLKLENVLLHENAVPKLTDYGLHEMLAPQEAASASSSESPSERDIYMLGEMLLQIATRKRGVVFENVERVVMQVKEEEGLLEEESLEVIERIARIAFWCMQDQPFLRPSIGEVVKVLQGTLSVDRPPSRHRPAAGVAEIEAEG